MIKSVYLKREVFERMIKFACSNCGHRMGASEKYAGKKVKCKKCGQITRIPEAQQAPEAHTEQNNEHQGSRPPAVSDRSPEQEEVVQDIRFQGLKEENQLCLKHAKTKNLP